MPPQSARKVDVPPTMPTTLALEMVERVRDEHELDVTTKLGMLAALSQESISFKAPDQAMKMISILGQIISSNLDSRLQAAALEIMERMIDLEQEAELQYGRAQIKWDMVNIIREKAKHQESMSTLVDEGLTIIADNQDENPDEEEEEEEKDLKREARAPKPHMGMVPPLKHALDPNAPMAAPQPKPERPLTAEPMEPTITKVSLLNMLRTVASPGSEATMRELANKLIAKIESQATQTQSCVAPTCTES